MMNVAVVLCLVLCPALVSVAGAAEPSLSRAVEWREGERTVMAWPAPDELAVFKNGSEGSGRAGGLSGSGGSGGTNGSGGAGAPKAGELAARLGATVIKDCEVFTLLRLPGPRFTGDLEEDRRAVAALQDEIGRTVAPVFYSAPERSPANRLLLTGELAAVFATAEAAEAAEGLLAERGLRFEHALDFLPVGRIYRASNVIDAPLAARELLDRGLASGAWPLTLRPRFARE